MALKRDWARRVGDGYEVDPSRCRVADNPRTFIDQEKLRALADDIKEHGVIDSLDGIFQADHVDITDGQRRLAAVALLATEGHVIETIHVRPRRGNVVDAIFRGVSREGTREPLDVVDEIGLLELLEAKGVKDMSILQKRLPWSRGKIQHRETMRALGLPARQALRDGIITHNRALRLAKLPEADQNEQVAKVREAKSEGKKSAGMAAGRPGVRAVKALMADIDQQGESGLVGTIAKAVLRWGLGLEDEAYIRGKLNLGPSMTPEQRKQAALDAASAFVPSPGGPSQPAQSTQEATGPTPPAKPKKPTEAE